MSEPSPKEVVLAGSKCHLAVDPRYTDEQIRAYALAAYDWEDITIERAEHIVLVQPTESSHNELE